MSATLQETADAILITRVAHRDGAAFQELFDRFQRQGFNLAQRIIGSQALAEEAFQEAMLVVWNRAPSFSAHGQARGWILKIIAYTSYKAYKQARRTGTLEAKALSSGRLFVSDPAAEGQELQAALRACLSNLKVEERQLISFYFGAELTCQEIGRELKMPTRTVLYKISRILERLRAQLKTSGFASAALPAALVAEALCAGPAPTEGLLERVLSNLPAETRPGTPGPWGPPGARGAAAPAGALGSKAVAILAAAAVAGLAAATGNFFASQDPSGGAAPQTSAISAARIPEPGPVLRWEFERTEDTRGLQLMLGLGGGWIPSGGAGTGGGCLAFSPQANARIVLPRLEGPFPYLLTMKLKAGLSDTSLKPELCPYPAAPFSCFLNRGTVPLSSKPAWLSWRYYITEEAIDEWSADQHLDLLFPECGEQRRLVLNLEGAAGLDDLELRPIRPAEVPNLAPYREVLSGLSRRDRGRELMVPRIPSARPPLKTHLRAHLGPGESAPQVKYPRTMNFDRQDEWDDLYFSSGSWSWKPNGGVNDSGCLDLKAGTLLELEGFRVALPVRVRCRVRALDLPPARGAQFSLLTLQFKGTELLAQFRSAGRTVSLSPSSWPEFSAVVSDLFTDQYLDGQRIDLSHIRPAFRPDGHTVLMLYIGHALLFDDLAVEPLRPEEAAPPPPLLEALRKIPPDSPQGEFPVLGIPAGAPGKTVVLRYLRPALTKSP